MQVQRQCIIVSLSPLHSRAITIWLYMSSEAHIILMLQMNLQKNNFSLLASDNHPPWIPVCCCSCKYFLTVYSPEPFGMI